jgi:alpha 1,3-glucosidase
MKNDPFTLTVATSSPSIAATLAEGELYLDDGETYAHTTRGELLWRKFKLEATKGKKNNKSMLLSSRDLVAPSLAAHPGKPIVDASGDSLYAGSTLGAVNDVFAKYDAVENAFVKSVEHVVVEKIVILGLVSAPRGVALGEEKLEFSFDHGKHGHASVLTIKSPKVSIARDWDIVLEL